MGSFPQVRRGQATVPFLNMTTLYSIGYAAHSIDSFLDLLHENRVTHIADVRDAPVSRKAGFGKNQLRQALADAGITYRHFPDLGTPKQLRDRWKAGAMDAATFFGAYREHLLAVGLDDLAALVEFAKAAPTAMLCLEADPRDCHRLIVGEEAAKRHRVRVVHL